MGKRFERQMQSMARADAQVAALNRQVAELERRIAELEAENRALRTPVPEAYRRAFEGGVA